MVLVASFQNAVHKFLTEAVLKRDDIDRFLDPNAPKWARFDSELGYVPHSCQVPDGMDGAVSTYRYGQFGERLMINHAEQMCRINSYGDSFTQCQQVSDGETWQEYLAAHLGEPIRNFGVGGYGVYQAYLRLRRVEAIEASAEHVLFNVYFDDHYRSLDAYRRLRAPEGWRAKRRSLTTCMFHKNPWSYVRLDESGALAEYPNPCASEESLYRLCDRNFLVDAFEDDLIVHLLVGQKIGQFDFLDRHTALANALGVSMDTSDERAGARSARLFYDRCALRASILLIRRVRTELSEQGKRLLVLLTYPSRIVAGACRGEGRPDREFLQQLDDLGIEYVDALAGHVADYADFSIDPLEYVGRYYNGHYNPTGNHFFGFTTKQTLANWLYPAPPAYLGEVERRAGGIVT